MLHDAYARGRSAALAKFAAVPLARPASPASRVLPGIHAPLAQPHAAPAAAPHAQTAPAPAPRAVPAPQPGFQLTPQEEAQAQRMKGMTPEQRANELGLGRDQQNAHFMQQHGITPAGAAPGMVQRMRAGAGRFMRPMGRGLALAGLAAGGAALYGLHRQNQEDRDMHNLVYAPMEGTY